jgi:hypothetical protein
MWRAMPSGQSPMITGHSRLPGDSRSPLFTLAHHFPPGFVPICATVAGKSWEGSMITSCEGESGTVMGAPGGRQPVGSRMMTGICLVVFRS